MSGKSGFLPNNRYWLLLPGILFFIVFFIFPLFTIFYNSITPDASSYPHFFSSSYDVDVLLRTLWVALLVTVFDAVIAYPLALYVVDESRKYRGFVLFAILAPMLVSAVVRAFGWIILFSPGGVLQQIGQALGINAGYLLYTVPGIVIALMHVYIPFMVLSLATALQGINPNLHRAGRILGANRIKTFTKITLPLSIPGLVSGCLIVFSLSTSAFVTPTLIGGTRIPLMSYLIYNEGILLLNDHVSATIAMILLIVTVTIAVLQLVAGNRARRR